MLRPGPAPFAPPLVRQAKRRKNEFGKCSSKGSDEADPTLCWSRLPFSYINEGASRASRARFFQARPNKINLCINSVNYEAHKVIIDYLIVQSSLPIVADGLIISAVRVNDYLSQGKLIPPIGKAMLVPAVQKRS